MVKLSDVILIIVAIIFPPAAAAFVTGCSCDLLINILLTILGYIPGHIHAFWLIYKKTQAEECYGQGGYTYVGNGTYEPTYHTQSPVGQAPYYGATDLAFILFNMYSIWTSQFQCRPILKSQGDFSSISIPKRSTSTTSTPIDHRQLTSTGGISAIAMTWRISTEIRVAVYGEGASGKSALIQNLQISPFMRPSDKRHFHFELVEGDLNECDSHVLRNFDFVLFTLDLHKPPIGLHCAEMVKLLFGTYELDLSRICVVGTKSDLVVQDHGTEDLEVRHLPTCLPFYGKVKYMATSSFTGIGFDDLSSFISNQLHPTLQYSFGTVLFNSFKESILDLISSIFALPIPERVNIETPDSYDLPDDDALEPLWRSPEAIAHNQHLAQFSPTQTCPAWRISPTLIAKPLKLLEWSNTVYARKSFPGIPIPQPRYPHLKYWSVSDFVQGRMLLECWGSLGAFMQFRIACTLRGYVAQMRKATQSIPGSIDGGHVSGNIFCPGMTGFHGPFKSASRFRDWINEGTFQGWLDILVKALQARERNPSESIPLPDQPVFSTSTDWSLVFVHGDLNLSNIILADDGVLWLIDWADSGYYPSWVEALAAYRFDLYPESWKHLLWFIVGPRPQYEGIWPYFQHYSTNHMDAPTTPRDHFWP
ncbi:unnamed protein product [Cyclocybe aegerita]|uniref:Aminoglycoside phosphotransferase domain-containing protein n=1 Tax=Cyclocybe aegerita TaxID=1973307 RepID=A0A8S0W2K4_CYCAE|nr:unnamed protein product [Cyclocybe aegerita]